MSDERKAHVKRDGRDKPETEAHLFHKASEDTVEFHSFKLADEKPEVEAHTHLK